LRAEKWVPAYTVVVQGSIEVKLKAPFFNLQSEQLFVCKKSYWIFPEHEWKRLWESRHHVLRAKIQELFELEVARITLRLRLS
jgi:hypothetical protein